LRDIGIRRSVLFAYDPEKLLPMDRGDILKGYDGKKGLIDMAKEAGVEDPLIDTMVL
ncbi:MAG: tetrahydromethanopterin S-methyltransferase subunit H, partial [Candidatus Thorarchaeota archaeon]|nr:tetrahydromethanopterin S-methyltransferase subunit H [Candidatus Thorarchaeota archaeon]NIW14028.1 tetrahydromethanopterin S-methyltransferase subunit H [Candidatus Thorarchaeota archaeon]